LRTLRLLIVGRTAAAVFAGCDPIADRPFELDASWHEQALVDGRLSHWLTVAPTASRFLQSSVTRTWQRRERKSTDVVAQSPQIPADRGRSARVRVRIFSASR